MNADECLDISFDRLSPTDQKRLLELNAIRRTGQMTPEQKEETIALYMKASVVRKADSPPPTS